MSNCADRPVISVVMPTYNQGRFVGQAIDSVLTQTERNLELIIIDNFSDDETREVVLARRDSRVHYHLFHNHGVIAASRNEGIRRAKGNFIAFLDSDDYWDPRKLELQLGQFVDAEILAVGSRAELFGEPLYYREQGRYDARAKAVDYRYRELLNENQVITSSVVVRAAAVSETLFNEDPDYICFEDWDLWLQLAKRGKIRVVTDKLVHYRVSLKREEAYSQIAKNMLKLLAREREQRLLPEVSYDEPESRILRIIARSYLQHNVRKSGRYYWRALRLSRRFNVRCTAFLGLLLCFTPAVVRPSLVAMLYRLEHTLIRGRF